MQAKFDKVSDKLSRMSDDDGSTGSVLDQMGVKKDVSKIREEKEASLRAQVSFTSILGLVYHHIRSLLPLC